MDNLGNCILKSRIRHSDFSFDELLIKQSYQAVHLIITDFLETLPFDCVQLLIETDAKFGVQQKELNISLSAVGQLVTYRIYL